MIKQTQDIDSYSNSLDEMFTREDYVYNNAMAASTVNKIFKIRKKTIRESLQCFQKGENRLEKVLKIKGVHYINDSGATSLNAAYYSLKTVRAMTVWIAGGQDAAHHYEQLLPIVNEKVSAIICIGTDNTNLIRQFDNCVDLIVEANTMQEAVKMAYRIAEKGDTVLLSPGCEGQDRFKDYRDRGLQFKEAVRNL